MLNDLDELELMSAELEAEAWRGDMFLLSSEPRA
jgi:hypothetical protein